LWNWVRATPIRLELSQEDSDRLREILAQAVPQSTRRRDNAKWPMPRIVLAGALVLLLILLLAAVVYLWIALHPQLRMAVGPLLTRIATFLGVKLGIK
jgi:cytochrome c-type biogenesis protein CcmH/NrfG